MGVSKTLALIIERAQHDYLSQGICGRCIEHFLNDGFFFYKLKISQRMCEFISAFATQKILKVSLSSNVTPKGQNILRITKFRNFFKTACSQFVLYLRKVVC